MFFVFIAAQSFAEVQNDPRRFESIQACDAYIEFLDRAVISDPTDCHQIAAFLVRHQQLGLKETLENFRPLTGDETTLRALIDANISGFEGPPSETFVLSELAGRRVAIKMASSADVERASLYSHVLYRLQLDAFQALCHPSRECDDIPLLTGISWILGDEFTRLDFLATNILLGCLIKTDGYLLPVREVLRSNVFENCILPQG